MINYLANSLRGILKEAELKDSAVERIMRNTDLRCNPATAKAAISEIKNAIGSHKFQKATRQDAKRVIAMLEKHLSKDPVPLTFRGNVDEQEGQKDGE